MIYHLLQIKIYSPTLSTATAHKTLFRWNRTYFFYWNFYNWHNNTLYILILLSIIPLIVIALPTVWYTLFHNFFKSKVYSLRKTGFYSILKCIGIRKNIIHITLIFSVIWHCGHWRFHFLLWSFPFAYIPFTQPFIRKYIPYIHTIY